MKNLLKTTILTLSLAAFSLGAQAETAPTLAEKLNARKTGFAAKADPEKRKAYDRGIEQVAEMGVLEAALNVGGTAPDFTLPNALGEQVTLSDALREGPVVIIWYRGEWCPYCNLQLEDIQSHADEFKAAGARVMAISPETPDKGWSLQDRMEIKFDVLSDSGNKIAKEYGVAYTLPEKIAGYLQEAFDIHGANADESNVLPLGAAYVVGQDGVVTYAFLDADYRNRAETTTLLEEVRKLKAGEQ